MFSKVKFTSAGSVMIVKSKVRFILIDHLAMLGIYTLTIGSGGLSTVSTLFYGFPYIPLMINGD